MPEYQKTMEQGDGDTNDIRKSDFEKILEELENSEKKLRLYGSQHYAQFDALENI